MDAAAGFTELDADAQAAVREQQRKRKLERAAKKEAAKAERSAAATPLPPGVPPLAGSEHPDRLSHDDYFDAVPSGLFHHPSIKATPEHVTRILSLAAHDEEIASYGYFVFGKGTAVWDPTFNALLLWEGFFTITAELSGKQPQPLPELQPFYGVLHWHFFEASASVKKTLRRLRASVVPILGAGSVAAPGPATAAAPQDGAEPGAEEEGAPPEHANQTKRRLRIVSSADPEATWRRLDAYQAARNAGNNWLTPRYLAMLLAASRDETVNFWLHAIELREVHPRETDAGEGDTSGEAHRTEGREADTAREGAVGEVVLAGELGFSVGRVYTSLSGWTEARTTAVHGSAQLALLGRWLQQRGYAFWSLGHCYSPEVRVLASFSFL